MSYKSIKRVKRQMEIPGSTGPLEDALDDLSDRMDEIDKLKQEIVDIRESLEPAQDRLAEIMLSVRKSKVLHRGRNFSVSEPELKPKLRVTKQKSV